MKGDMILKSLSLLETLIVSHAFPFKSVDSLVFPTLPVDHLTESGH